MIDEAFSVRLHGIYDALKRIKYQLYDALDSIVNTVFDAIYSIILLVRGPWQI